MPQIFEYIIHGTSIPLVFNQRNQSAVIREVLSIAAKKEESGPECTTIRLLHSSDWWDLQKS